MFFRSLYKKIHLCYNLTIIKLYNKLRFSNKSNDIDKELYYTNTYTYFIYLNFIFNFIKESIF